MAELEWFLFNAHPNFSCWIIKVWITEGPLGGQVWGLVVTSICISLSCSEDSSPLQLMRAESCLQCRDVEGLPFSWSILSRRALALRLDQSSLW